MPMCVALFFAACDDDKPAPTATATQTAAQQPVPAPPQDQEIVAAPAYRDIAVGTTFYAKLTSQAVVPTEPSKKVRRKTGQLRAVDVTTNVATQFRVTRAPNDGSAEVWKLQFETFSKQTERPDAPTAKTDHDLPDRTLLVALTEEGPVVTDEEGNPTTESQSEFGVAIARDLATRQAWGKFLSSREFPQGKIVEASENMVLGKFAEVFFGEVLESHTTVSLFRLALEEGSEAAIFEVHSRTKTKAPDGRKDVFMDIESRGKIVVRIVDGVMLRYTVDSKVVPRNEAGAMLPVGSGSWTMTFDVDAGSYEP